MIQFIQNQIAKNQNQAMNLKQKGNQEAKSQNNFHHIKHNNPQQQNPKSAFQNVTKKQQQQKQCDYYQEFCKLYLANAVLETHLKELSIQKSQLLGKLHKLQKKAQQSLDGNGDSNTQRKKRIRRSAADIARHYKCSHENCSKSYGSQGSLNQHIKLKHPDLFKTLNIPESMLLRDFMDESISDSSRQQ